MTSERRQELRAWYSDPVRKLPRKVVADVLALLEEVENAARVVGAVEAWTGNPCLCGGLFPNHKDNCVWLIARKMVGREVVETRTEREHDH